MFSSSTCSDITSPSTQLARLLPSYPIAPMSLQLLQLQKWWRIRSKFCQRLYLVHRSIPSYLRPFHLVFQEHLVITTAIQPSLPFCDFASQKRQTALLQALAHRLTFFNSIRLCNLSEIAITPSAIVMFASHNKKIR